MKRRWWEDVKRIRNHPPVPKSIHVYGYLYDAKTGKVEGDWGSHQRGAGASLGADLSEVGGLGCGGISEAA